MAPSAAQVSVVAPIQPAIERARRLLFQPFDLAKWFAIGFCAWLARLGEGGFSGFNGSGLFRPWAGHVPDFPGGHGDFGSWEQGRAWVVENLYWIGPLAATVVCVVVALWLLLAWLGSRGEFMFLHCVTLDRAEVAVPWRRYARQAWSLFLFRLALGLVAAVPMLLLLAAVVVVGVQIAKQGEVSPALGLPIFGAALAMLFVGFGYLVVAKLTRDLVVPIMLLRGGTARQAWSELLGLVAGRVHLLIVYLLFQLVLAMAIGAAVLVAVIATCCVAGCLLALPYLGTVALLPILVFARAYSVYYLGQLGPEYDLFSAAAQPAAAQPPVAQPPVSPA